MYVRTRVTSCNLLVSRCTVSIQYVCTVPGLCVYGWVCACLYVRACACVLAYLYNYIYIYVYIYIYLWLCPENYVPTYHGVQNYTSHALLSFCLGIWHLCLSRSLSSLDVLCSYRRRLWSQDSACCDCEVYSADLAYCEHVVNKVLNFERVEALAAWVLAIDVSRWVCICMSVGPGIWFLGICRHGCMHAFLQSAVLCECGVPIRVPPAMQWEFQPIC